jgi:16S rRNA U516 pseudouridylate synthase RsuA-like enzyme
MERAMRLDKLLTELGTGSRSEVKKYIRSGLVTVNGEVVKKPEQRVDEKNNRNREWMKKMIRSVFGGIR